MIKTYDAHLPDWIERQASLGWKEGNVRATEDNMFWAMLKNSCPLIFESYAIVLHPFGINWKLKDIYDAGLLAKRDTEGWEQISWRDIFNKNGFEFNLETAYQTHLELENYYRELESGWPIYLYAPAEGSYEPEKLQLIINQIINTYGDVLANYFYVFMQSKKWDAGDYFYIGQLSEFPKLKDDQDNRDGITPTAIYPDTKEWCIVSDYDSPFTFIAGSKQLIDSITRIDGI